MPPLLIENDFRLLEPAAEATQYTALMQKLHDEDLVRNYQAMNHWIRDHVPFPGADHLVPPASAAAWTTVVSSAETEELRLSSGRVGLICGKGSTRTTQPQVAEWLTRNSDAT